MPDASHRARLMRRDYTHYWRLPPPLPPRPLPWLQLAVVAAVMLAAVALAVGW